MINLQAYTTKTFLIVGEQQLEVSSFNIESNTVSMESFPTASVALAVGTSVVRPGVHTVTNEILQLFYTYPFCTIEIEITKVSDDLELPSGLAEGKYTIFAGDIVSISSSKDFSTMDTANVSVNLEIAHIARRLTFASIADYPFYGMGFAMYASVLKTTGVKVILETDSISSDPDIWNKYIKPTITYRTTGDISAVGGSSTAVADSTATAEQVKKESVNTNEKSELQRFLTEAIDSIAVDFNISKLKVDNIKAYIDSKNNNSSYYMSPEITTLNFIYLMILDLCAYMVPTSTGLHLKPIHVVPESIDDLKEITVNDYISSTIAKLGSAATTRFISGGSIYSGAFSFGTINGKVDRHSVFYLPDSLRKGGLLVNMQAPPWLENSTANIDSSSGSSSSPSRAKGKTELFRTSNLEQEVLKNYLAYSVCRQRLTSDEIVVNCPLRFDIAQGTFVKVEIPAVIEATGEASTWYVGVVTRVGHRIDSEESTCMTTIVIGQLESVEAYEAVLDLAKHPFTNVPYKDLAWATPS